MTDTTYRANDTRSDHNYPVRVVVACGPSMVTESITARLSREVDLLPMSAPGAIGLVSRAGGTVESLAPQVVVIDLTESQQDEELTTKLRSLPSHPAVVALVQRNSAQLAARLVKGGTAGVVTTSAPGQELAEAVRWSSRGSSWISPTLLREVLDKLHGSATSVTDERLAKLTAREREIVQLMVDGLGRQEMADRLNLSVSTVRTHMRTTMEKLEVHSATATVSVALDAGMRPTPTKELVGAAR